MDILYIFKYCGMALFLSSLGCNE